MDSKAACYSNLGGRRFAIALVVLALSFSVGAITGAARGWFQPGAEITIHNASGFDISNLQLITTTADVTSTSVINSLPRGEKKVLHIYVAGEAGYSIVATLSNGTVVKGGAGYVESGFSVTETVGSSKIESSHHYGL